MSAEKYTNCPNCIYTIYKEQKKLRKELDESYGHIPQEEWYKKSLNPKLDPPQSDTLAMYYKLYIEDNQLVIDCFLKCNECEFEFNFKHKEPILKGE